MKRDMDIVRQIALEAAEMPFGARLVSVDGVSEEAFAAHVIWMTEAGLVKSLVTEFMDKSVKAEVERLTWDGCEFADAVANDTLWAKAKSTVIKPSASWTFGLLTDWLKAEMAQGFPTIRGQI